MIKVDRVRIGKIREVYWIYTEKYIKKHHKKIIMKVAEFQTLPDEVINRDGKVWRFVGKTLGLYANRDEAQTFKAFYEERFKRGFFLLKMGDFAEVELRIEPFCKQYALYWRKV